MSLYFVIPFLALLAIFQATAAPQIRIAGGSLNLLLLSVMSWEQIEARGDGYVWAFIGGVFLDLISGGPFGASILGLLAATFVANRLGGGLFRDRLLLPLVTAVAGTFAYNGVYLILLRIFGVPINPVNALVQVVLPSALLNMLASPIVARLMLALHRRVKPAGAAWQ
jgi:rod shape-determining protein MreD